jgi:hypothetical protein
MDIESEDDWIPNPDTKILDKIVINFTSLINVK